MQVEIPPIPNCSLLAVHKLTRCWLGWGQIRLLLAGVDRKQARSGLCL